MFGFIVLRHDSNSGEITEREVFGNDLKAAQGYEFDNNHGAIAVGYPAEYSVWYVDGAYRFQVVTDSCEAI